MFPGGVNPKQMAGMMKKMGISQENLPVRKVIFEMDDGNLVIEEPDVMKIKMQGQESYQITGEAVEESLSSFSEEDVALVAEKSGKSEGEARAALESSDGDIAEAIVELQ
jgi:nascent polypeptide-associated complex subunit alpha